MTVLRRPLVRRWQPGARSKTNGTRWPQTFSARCCRC